MLRWDRHLESWIASHRVGALDEPFRLITYAGTWGAVWLVLGLALAVRLRRPRVLVWTALADLAAQLSTLLIQHVVGRSRPDVHTLVAEPHSHSFPSGHAASSFACVVVLAFFAPRLTAPLYALAVLIAFSRLYVGVHFPLDVIAGAAWGFVLGKALLDLGRLRPAEREPAPVPAAAGRLPPARKRGRPPAQRRRR